MTWCPPIGRRRLGMGWLARCPACRHAHVVRGTSAVALDGALRRVSCGRLVKIKVSSASLAVAA